MTERVFSVHVEARPDGAVLTPSDAYTECLLKDVVALLAERPDLMDDLDDLISNPAPARDPHLPDRPSRDDQLVERIVRGLPEASRKIRLQEAAAVSLRDRLSTALNRWTGWRAA